MASTLILIPAAGLGYVLLRIIYNLFFHPLRSYPGPFLGRATILAYQKASLDGNLPLWLHELHRTYGPVVRYAPNDLSFIKAEAWKDIYGHRATAFEKQKAFYGPDPYGSPPGLIRANNEDHARQRKLVSHAFSDKALREQESMFKVYASLLVERLKQTAEKDGKADLVSWYNFCTFDIMGDLTFGDSLKLLEQSQYTPWVKAIFNSIKLIMLTNIIRRWPMLDRLLQRLIPANIRDQRKAHMKYASDHVDKRLASKTDRPDIWTYILRHSESEENSIKGLHPTEMHSNGALFMLAGTETTATELSGLTYYLLKNPDKLQRLQKELRAAFSSLDDITMNKLSQLEYLGACIEEVLRIYPPVAVGPPRTVPKSGGTVAGNWVPGGSVVSLAQYAAYHSPSNFEEPESFLPERWLVKNHKEYETDHKEVLNPFSYGPRNCLGKNLAYHEMRLIIASVFTSFDMELCNESNNWPEQSNYILWNKGPLSVKLRPVGN